MGRLTFSLARGATIYRGGAGAFMIAMPAKMRATRPDLTAVMGGRDDWAIVIFGMAVVACCAVLAYPSQTIRRCSGS